LNLKVLDDAEYVAASQGIISILPAGLWLVETNALAPAEIIRQHKKERENALIKVAEYILDNKEYWHAGWQTLMMVIGKDDKQFKAMANDLTTFGYLDFGIASSISLTAHGWTLYNRSKQLKRIYADFEGVLGRLLGRTAHVFIVIRGYLPRGPGG